MADVGLAKNTGDIKNGEVIVATSPYKFQVEAPPGTGLPIAAIQNKYLARFDDNYEGSYPPASGSGQ